MKPQTTVLHPQILTASELRKVYALLACVGIAVLGGCGGEESASTQEFKPPANYKFTMVNQKSEPITTVTILGMPVPAKFSKIAAGSSQTLLGKGMDLPDTVTVGWTDSRGNRHNTDVKLEIPKRFNGSLKFTILASGKVTSSAGSAP